MAENEKVANGALPEVNVTVAPPKPPEKKKHLWFKVNQGVHSEDGVRYHFRDNPYVNTWRELDKMFNSRNSKKFSRLAAPPSSQKRRPLGSDPIPKNPPLDLDLEDDEDFEVEETSTSSSETTSSSQLHSMTRAELEDYAIDNQISIDGLRTKKEILDRIQEFQGR